MTNLKKKKRKSNNSFLLAVILMVSLIITILIPTAMAWFTGSDTGSSNTPINFGTVDINVEQNADTSAKVEFTNLNSPARALEAVLPGDSIEFSFNVINTGSVDTYAKVSFAPKIMYGETDITPLLYDTTTDPVNQPYWIVDNTNNTTDNPDFYTDGDPNNQVFVLATGETKQIKGVLQLKTTLPNSVTDGTNPPYQLNGHEEGMVKLVLDIDMAAIQKDNLDLDIATPELNKYVDSMAINYSFTYLNGNPTLTVAGKPVETEEPYEVGATEDTKAYAFVKEINGEKTLLAVVGEGDMQDYDGNNQPWYNTRTNITNVVIEDGITTIGAYAFSECSNLTSVTIPDSVKTIGEAAFCSCINLTNITIPNSVTTIGANAFDSCIKLESINIPASVTNIGDWAFCYLPSLTNITVENGNPNYKSDNNCLIETATNTLLAGCNNSVIPNYITTIADYTFCGLTFTEFVIPNSVITIEDYAFGSCEKLEKIIIGNNVQTIGAGVFEYCTSLLEIIIPDSVTTLGAATFRDCTNLKSIIIGNGLTTIPSSTFYNCTSLTNVKLGENVKSIQRFAFRNCTSLEYLILPQSVTSMPTIAYQGCTNLTTIYSEHTIIENFTITTTKQVYFYSETNQAGYWHYDTDGIKPVLW